MTVINGNQMIVLTPDELQEFASEVARNIIEQREAEKPQEIPKRYVYGISGICDLFNISPVTAQRYKNGFLAPAVMQCGRKITVDADLAMKLFKQQQEQQEV